MKINGYSIFVNEDEAIYCAKSKEDVYDYFVNNYGSTEVCQDQTKSEFIECLEEIALDSEYAVKESTWYDEGEDSHYDASLYNEYKTIAERNDGTCVICYLAQ